MPKSTLRVGGQYRIANLLPSGQTIWIHGKYELVNRPDKLIYTWGIGLDGTADERVTVTFMATENGTEVVVFHENAPNVSTRDSHESGWHGCLEGLAALAP